MEEAKRGSHHMLDQSEGEWFHQAASCVKVSNAHADLAAVIPAWDQYGGDLLRGALTNLRQQAPGAQVIVVDNASETAVDTGGLADQVVKLEQRTSVGEARNRGLAGVDRPSVMFLDADDLLLPGSIDRLASQLTRSDAVAVVMSLIAWNPATACTMPWPWPRPWAYRAHGCKRSFAALTLLANPYPVTGATLLLTDAVRESGGFGESDFSEDWPLAAALAFRGRIKLDPRPGRLYRIHENSLVDRHQSLDAILTAWTRLEQRLRDDPAVPGVVRTLLPLAATWRRRDAARKTAEGRSAHADVFARIGHYRLDQGQPPEDEVNRLMARLGQA